MKKIYFIIILFVCRYEYSKAQILSINCYNQNNSIGMGMNNLLLNGGFENSNCPPYPPVVTFCPNSTIYPLCTIANWTCTGGGDSTYACIADSNSLLSTIPEGTKVAYFGNWICHPCSSTANDTFCIIHNGCLIAGIPSGYPVNSQAYGGSAGVSLEQTVNGLTTGNTYVLEFWAGGEYTSTITRDGIFAVNVGFGDTLLNDKATSINGGIGTEYLIKFNAVSSSHTIKFTNWGHIGTGCTELVLDNAQLYTLAELSTNENNKNDAIKLFPNPVIDKLNITVSNYELSEIILYDITSRKLLEQKFINSISLKTEQFAKGIYIYEVRDKDGMIKIGKVVKE